MKKRSLARVLYEARRFALFFLLVAFVVSCCMMLFLTTMSRAMRLTLAAEDIQLAAKITFANVILLTSLLLLLDRVYRRLTVERQLRIITDAAARIVQGDFAVRIPPLGPDDGMDAMQQVADCMNHMAAELSGMETLRSDFIANVSHELKTPLAVMSNYAALLERPVLDEQTRIAYAQEIGTASRRLSALITDILRLNKLENQQIYPKAEAYDLSAQLAGCLLAFEDAWTRKGLAVEADIADGVQVTADAALLALVWNNLIANAVKFTDAGTVRVSLHLEGKTAVVRVADTGCGFGGDVGRHIFEKFYQGDRSRATQGNGLGLALVRRVVDIVGGDVSVESEAGRGSAFTVRIGRAAYAAYTAHS